MSEDVRLIPASQMMITAENICDQWGLTREELDEFAAVSQQKAVAAQESGAFDDEIVPVPVKVKKETVMIHTTININMRCKMLFNILIIRPYLPFIILKQLVKLRLAAYVNAVFKHLPVVFREDICLYICSFF